MILWAAAMTSRADGQSVRKPAAVAAPAHTEEIGVTGSEACAKCHRAIFDAYAGTAMARSSGPAMRDFLPGEFQHAASGIRYRVYEENGNAWLSFDRTGEGELHGKRKLQYFIGSGHRGRAYLFADDGFVFESPVSFYALKEAGAKDVWDMAPAFENEREMPLNVPAGTSCLTCHASNAQTPMTGTENKYGTPLFAHDGITCERCHGSGAAHMKETSAEPGVPPNKSHVPDPPGDTRTAASLGIVNPAKLAPARRDAVCMQCHLQGNAAIEQPGRRLDQFQPGEDLSDFVRYFVLSGDGKEGARGVSQFEALAQSKCKRASGDAMTCTSCHDPHASPAAAEKVAFYRGKCLVCHGEAFAAKHHVEQEDCAKCHMARLATADVPHTQISDHRILRVPMMPLQSVGSAYDPSHGPPPEPKLTRFPVGPAVESVRDLALAWSALAGDKSGFASTEAARLLPLAVVQSPEDPAILTALGYNELRSRQTGKAREHYEHALRIDPLSVDAAANLGVIEANAGHLDRAVELWKAAFERAPARSSLGLNLTRGLCLTGQGDQAQAVVSRVLEFNPDMGAARSTLKQLESGAARCIVR